MRKHLNILFLVSFPFCLVFTGTVRSQAVINLTDSTPVSFIGKSMYYLVDSSDKLRLNDVLQPGIARQFKKFEDDVPNFGNVRLTVWNKFTVVNNSQNKWILSNHNDTDSMQFYYSDNSGQFQQVYGGVSLPVSARKYKTLVLAFDLPAQQGDTATFYVRIATRNCEYSLIISSYSAFIADQFKKVLGKGMYFGLVLLIIVYNLVLFIAIRERIYIYYLLYVLFTALLIAVLSGVYPYILQDKLHFLWDSGPAITAIGGIFLFLFTKSFLKLKETAPRINFLNNYFFIPLLVLNIFLDVMGYTLIASISNQLLGIVGLITMAATAVYVYLKGYKAARFYILACSFYFFGVVLYVLKAFNLLEYNFFTTNAMEIGSALEMTLFSVSLGDQINIYRREKAQAKTALIKSLQEKTTIQHEMLELEAKALRSQMNPHFIFNCMNSIKSLIQQKEDDKAIKYLTTFSKLLRTILENSDKREITLHDEIETCRLYMQLEGLRFGNKFQYDIEVDPEIDIKSVQVPALILQPFIENAIWHGILPKKEDGFIKVSIEKEGEAIYCIIDDNGVGRAVSIKNSSRHQYPNHQSKGEKITRSRLDLDNALNHRNASVETIDKANEEGEATGTRIVLTFKEFT